MNANNLTSLDFLELMRYSETESCRWFDWFEKNPAALEVPTDVAETKNVRGLLLHIVAVDQRYAERLHDQSVTPYEAVPLDLDGLRKTHEWAFSELRRFLNSATEAEWKRIIEFPTRSIGTLKSNKRKIFVHTLMHAMRHFAQMAAILRAAGFPQDWQHDLLFSDAIE